MGKQDAGALTEATQRTVNAVSSDDPQFVAVIFIAAVELRLDAFQAARGMDATLALIERATARAVAFCEVSLRR